MTKKTFDLANMDTVAACNEGSEIELRHPVTNEPLGIFWTVYGVHSDTYREYWREIANERIRKEEMAKKRGRGSEILTAESVEEQGIDFLTVCSKGWRTGDKPTITLRNEELAFNVPNVKKVLSGFPWVRKQIDEGISDLENFMKD